MIKNIRLNNNFTNSLYLILKAEKIIKSSSNPEKMRTWAFENFLLINSLFIYSNNIFTNQCFISMHDGCCTT